MKPGLTRPLAFLLKVTVAGACGACTHSAVPRAPGLVAPLVHGAVEPADARAYREGLVAHLRASHAATSERVLDAMARVPRHLFVPAASLRRAYADRALDIGLGQTISQPTVVARMTEALDLDGTQRVLEIGTGSGYQAAVLSLLSRELYSIELLPALGEVARARLAELGYRNASVRIGDGYAGWPDRAPFDRVILTAAPPVVPQALFDQLADGGILVAPIGDTGRTQELVRYRKSGGRVTREDLGPVRFVPMVPGS